jgi:membrane-bound ClpP family serine protease
MFAPDFILTLGVFSFVQNIGILQAALFILGILLLIVEAFHPGFGVAGISGLVLVVVGIILTAQTPLQALVMFLILLAIVAVILVFILRSAKKGRLSRKLILHSASRRENGFSATADNSALLGLEGKALTMLRPAGTGEFDGKRLDVVTEGDFLAKGSRIRIVRTEGRRIVVEKID